MRRCDESECDVIVDGIAYKLDNAQEIKHLRNLDGLSGIAFRNHGAYLMKIERERRAHYASRRRARQHG